MIRYVVNGHTVERADHGEHARKVLASLARADWQTRAELGAHWPTLRRLLGRKLIQRRKRQAKHRPFEYALPGAKP